MDDHDILHLHDEDVEELRPAAEPESRSRAHLILGDSIPYRMRDRLDVEPYDLLFNHSRSGYSWVRVAADLDEEITRWRTAAAAFGCDLGTYIIWMSGNDVYPRGKDTSHVVRIADLEVTIEEVIGRTWGTAKEVLVLGPLPRFSFDAGDIWSDCPAFSAQQATKRVCDMYHLNVKFLPLARCFTKSYKKWHIVAHDHQGLFTSDGVHLSASGEDTVLQRIPKWLQWQH